MSNNKINRAFNRLNKEIRKDERRRYEANMAADVVRGEDFPQLRNAHAEFKKADAKIAEKKEGIFDRIKKKLNAFGGNDSGEKKPLSKKEIYNRAFAMGVVTTTLISVGIDLIDQWIDKDKEDATR